MCQTLANTSQVGNMASSQTDPDFNINAVTFLVCE